MAYEDMAVYIANLGKYNEGELVGAWFTFPIDEDDVAERIGLNEYYEEYAIHDTDNFPMEIGEYVSIQELNRIYEMVEELPDYIVEALDEFISHYGSLEEVVEHYDEVYYYPDCENMTDIAYYYIDELQALGDIPSNLQNYIDYEAFGRDLSFEGTFIDTGRGMCEIPY
ncbi:MAG: antirestriction protein ArdA [Clostridiales bacterium]|nr:antirestriction protein ArdA [Clostridiales bacterium]